MPPRRRTEKATTEGYRAVLPSYGALAKPTVACNLVPARINNISDDFTTCGEAMSNVSVIKRFEVFELFGLHDYKLDFGASSAGEARHETLLYGDNGTGKTTILKLMYHLLSKKRNEGSRTYLSRIPFKRILVELTEGQFIEMVKHQEQRLTFVDGTSSQSIIINPDSDMAVRASSNPDLAVYEKFLSDLKIEQLYLSDNRMIMTSYRRFDRRRLAPQEALREYEAVLLDDDSRRESPVLDTVDLAALGVRVRDIIREKLLESSVYGQSNVNNIYLDLAKRLSRPSTVSGPQRSPQTLTDIEKRVKVIASDYNNASSLEIFPRVDFEEFVSVARESGEQSSNAIAVIETYLDTVEAQVAAVKGVAQLLNDLVDEINSYLVNKRLTFSVRAGFKVTSAGKRLRFADLSSGERQLVFLMLVSFVTRDDKSIVYIDEPELSLNIKWQRRLISSILKLIDMYGLDTDDLRALVYSKFNLDISVNQLATVYDACKHIFTIRLLREKYCVGSTIPSANGILADSDIFSVSVGAYLDRCKQLNGYDVRWDRVVREQGALFASLQGDFRDYINVHDLGDILAAIIRKLKSRSVSLTADFAAKHFAYVLMAQCRFGFPLFSELSTRLTN